MSDFRAGMIGSGVLNFDQVAWEQMAWFALRPELYFDQIATVRATNQTTPHTNVSFVLTANLGVSTTPLGEKVDVALDDVSTSIINVTAEEYGNAVMATARVRAQSFVDLDPVLANLIGFNAGETMDTVAGAALTAGITANAATVVRYSQGDATPTVAEVASNDTIQAADIRYTVAKLRGANVPTIGGVYHGYIHPDVSYDLRSELGVAGLIEPVAYTDQSMVRNGVIGDAFGVRFIETPRAQVDADAGVGSAVDVYTTMILGQDALAKTHSNSAEYGAQPRIILGPQTDTLRRFVPIGWLHLAGYKAFRPEALRAVKSASSIA